MKNIQLYPFERNKYFFGKLLTVRDFEAEQKYFNDKRRVLNQLMYGTGVVCGMMTTRVDGSNVVIESGLALDSTGREIIIPEPVVKRLSDIDGFFNDSEIGLEPYVYLCAEYAEEDSEPVQGAEQGTQFGRTTESCRLYLTYDGPDHQPNHQVDASLEKRFENKQLERLYLAKIQLVRWETAYEIEMVWPIPFGQIVPSPLYCFQAMLALQSELDELKAQMILLRDKKTNDF